MKPDHSRRWALTAGLVFVLCHILLLPSLASANPGLRVDGAIVMIPVDPGVTYDHTLYISSGPGDPTLEIDIGAYGFGRSLDGAFTSLSPEEVDSPYSARGFVSQIDRPAFQLQPGAEEKVTLSIEMPDNAGPGGRYAIIGIRARRLDEGGLGTVAVVQVPVLLTVSRTELVHTGRINSLVVGNIAAGQPVTVSTVVANTGNHHYKASNEVTLSDSDGRLIARASAPLTQTQIIPLTSNLFEASFSTSDLPVGLPEGAYQIESRVIAEDGRLIDSEEFSFQFPGMPEEQRWQFPYWILGLVAASLMMLAMIALIWRRRRRTTS